MFVLWGVMVGDVGVGVGVEGCGCWLVVGMVGVVVGGVEVGRVVGVVVGLSVVLESGRFGGMWMVVLGLSSSMLWLWLSWVVGLSLLIRKVWVLFGCSVVMLFIGKLVGN